MINLISKIIFLFTIITGSLITISSSSWLGIWIGLEINLLSFIPLIIDKKNLFTNESAIKYFLIQVFGSLIFLFTRIIYITKIYYFNLFYEKLIENLIINSSIILKIGAAPFHFWLPNIIEGLSWNNSLLILTWQKLAPLIIISYSNSNNTILFIILSSFIGAIGGLNHTSLRKILTFRSINHIRWILIALIINNLFWVFYFLIYFIINFSIIFLFNIINIFNINQIFLFNNKSSLIKACLFINFFSLGGLPPFIGFFPKWVIIENLIINKNIFLIFFTIIITLITLYFYLRLTFTAFLSLYPNYSWNIFIINKNNIFKKNLICNFFLRIFFFIIINYYYYL